MNRMLGDDFARTQRVPLADIVYLQNRPIRLMPRRLRRRLSRHARPEREPAMDAQEHTATRVADLAGR